ncbi:MAG: stage III sporulation protein AB [Clostridia bacterium]|nr:stage III sporulation protein AB [Clostridia bacterium]MBQ2347159.1 stage III sporulation protein AB [Clostridia bacterium]
MNNMKITGAVLILITSWLTGIMLTAGLSDKENTLREFRQMFCEIKRRISYEMTDMCELINTCTVHYLKPFTDNMYNCLSQGKSIDESVQNALNNTPLTNVLESDEKDFIVGVMSSLGMADCEAVTEITDSAIIRLDNYIELAKENRQKNSRVYFIVSLYIGFAAVILMI